MLLPAIVIFARILADYDMLKFVIYIYIFFFFPPAVEGLQF